MNQALRIALIGYGKMGKTIERIMLERGHEVAETFSSSFPLTTERLKEAKADAAIEFTQPNAAVNNIKLCLDAAVPVAVGTTGWLKQLPELEKKRQETKGKFLHASNFSVGVNVMFELNRMLAKMMNAFPEYAVDMDEVHHTQKLDAPSGTAITLAEGIIEHLDGIDNWHLSSEEKNTENSFPIEAIREDDVKGIHNVRYTSPIDKIEISHEAFNRDGFALGSILAAEFLVAQNPGMYTMRDYFKSL